MKSLAILCLLSVLAVQAQTADERIGTYLNESRWFELAHELKATPADSVSPLIYKMATAMTLHYFNRPDSACIVLGDLLNNHAAELGNNSLSLAVLLGRNMVRTGRYADAAALMQNLCDQLEAQGVDSVQTAGLHKIARQYRTFADAGPICKPLHPEGTYRLPMGTHRTIHQARDQATDAHFLTMSGSINGQGSTLVFDTGAGVNIVSSRQARQYGLHLLDATETMSGIGNQQGHYALADTLRIGGMAWANVPFLIVDLQTNNSETDSIGSLLPPVIGLPILLSMQEVQLDFEHHEFIIPATPSSVPAGGSNMLRTDSESLRIATADESGQPLYFHFDTGGYNTLYLPLWFKAHADEVLATGIPDSLRAAGVGGENITRSYRLKNQMFLLGEGWAVLDSVPVDTGIDLHTGETKTVQYLNGEEDGTIGLNLLEQFRMVIINLKEMYLNGIPYDKED